jgi:hypothetical protein
MLMHVTKASSALLITLLVIAAVFLVSRNDCGLTEPAASTSAPVGNRTGGNAPSAAENAARNQSTKPPLAGLELRIIESDRVEGRLYLDAAATGRGGWLHGVACDIKIDFLVVTLCLIAFVGLLWTSAQKVLAATHQIAEAQMRDLEVTQRAYVSAHPYGVAPFNSAAYAEGHVGFRNAGKLPARNVRWLAVSADSRRAHFPIRELVGKNLIPPNSEMTQRGRAAISQDEFDNFLANNLWLYVWGTVRYDDGFGHERHTNFCHRYDTRGFSSTVGGLASSQVEKLGRGSISSDASVFHQYGNDAD